MLFFIDTNFDINIILAKNTEHIQIKRNNELKNTVYQFKNSILNPKKQIAELKKIMDENDYILYNPKDKLNLEQEINLYIINPKGKNEFEIIYGKNTDKFLSKKIRAEFSEEGKQIKIEILILPYIFPAPWRDDK